MSSVPTGDRVSDALGAAMPFAERLLATIGEATRDRTTGKGIRRDSYGPGETIAADLVRKAGEGMGLVTSVDDAGNVYLTLPGRDAKARAVIVGSHVDSAPNGGNFDGLAGVVAGLVCASVMKTLRISPEANLTVMAIRGEENAWFGAQHIGSRIALGSFDATNLGRARRMDTGMPLAQHMIESGLDPAAIEAGKPFLGQSNVRAFIELHIEQGPVLEGRSLPLGIVSGIRGNLRSANCKCTGRYDHSGTVPRSMRSDAVMASAELVAAMDRFWETCESDEEDLVLTFGKFSTDAAAHSVTTIPGEVRFSFDARSHSEDVLAIVRETLQGAAADIASKRGVTFDLGPLTYSAPVTMDSTLKQLLRDAAQDLALPCCDIASGAGHDAADFALAGIPAAMIFVRNANGSHNPDEFMSMQDFALGTRLLLECLLRMLDARAPSSPVP